LSGTGKTTLSNSLLAWSDFLGLRIKLIDGDVCRQTLCKDLGFSKADRLENIARLGAYAWSLTDAYDFIIIAAINPYEEARISLKRQYGAILIWLRCDLQTLIARDPKGLYRKALLSDHHPDKIHNLTSLNDTFETSLIADLIVDTDALNAEETLWVVVRFLTAVI